MQINEKVSRKTGNKVVEQVANAIKEELAPEYVFVRYMGPKFAIVFSGVDVNGVETFFTMIKEKIESIKIEPAEDYKSKKKVIVSPKVNIALTTYYKGTALEEVTRKLEEFLDNENENESNINYL